MKSHTIRTPAFLLELNTLESNIAHVAAIAQRGNKALLPMTKTHKSSEIAQMQLAAGAAGFLVGTVDEAVALSHIADIIMLPYPFLGEANLKLLREAAKRTKLILALDSLEAAKIYQSFFGAIQMSYLLIVDSGLHRLGVQADNAGRMVKQIQASCANLHFLGITTHPGQVYACENAESMQSAAHKALDAIHKAVASLEKEGFPCEVVATGSTPTMELDAADGIINVVHPGNYVFNDTIQIALGWANEDECALRVRASIISQPLPDLFIIDCGSKCLGLDKGAHGNTAIKGYGRVVGYDNLNIFSLSEEIAKVEITSTTALKIGDTIDIIPNHSCSTANMTSFYIGMRNGGVERTIAADIRGNSVKSK